jgi:hypothetical protein
VIRILILLWDALFANVVRICRCCQWSQGLRREDSGCDQEAMARDAAGRDCGTCRRNCLIDWRFSSALDGMYYYTIRAILFDLSGVCILIHKMISFFLFLSIATVPCENFANSADNATNGPINDVPERLSPCTTLSVHTATSLQFCRNGSLSLSSN